MLPDTITLTDEQFKTFLEKTVITDHSRRILDGLTTQNTATAAPQTTGTAAHNTTTIPKTAETARSNATDEGEDEGNGARVTG